MSNTIQNVKQSDVAVLPFIQNVAEADAPPMAYFEIPINNNIHRFTHQQYVFIGKTEKEVKKYAKKFLLSVNEKLSIEATKKGVMGVIWFRLRPQYRYEDGKHYVRIRFTTTPKIEIKDINDT